LKSFITLGLLCCTLIIFSQNKSGIFSPAAASDSAQLKSFGLALATAQRALKAKPNNAFNYYTIGQLYFDIKKYDSSLVYCKAAASIEPNQTTYQKALGYTYFAIQDFATALPYFESALRQEPTDDSCQYSAAICYYKTKQYLRCIDAMNATVLLNPKQIGVYKYLGTCHYLLKNYDEAIENYKKSILFYPDEADIHQLLGICYELTNQPYEASRQFNKALALSPNNPDIEINVAENKLKLNEFDEARRIYFHLLPTYESKEAIYYYIANVYYNEKKYDSATICYQQALTIAPDYTAAYLPLATAYYATKNFVSAIEWFTKAQRQTNTSAINNYLGLCYYGLNNAVKAIDYFNQALSIDKNNAIVYYNLAKVYNMLDQPQKAISYLDISTRLLPQDADGLLLLAKLHAKTGNSKEAINNYLEAITIRPSISPSKALADLYTEDHQYDKALNIYRVLISLDSNNAALQYRMGVCYEGNKLWTNALESYLTAMRNNPTEKLYLYAVANIYFQQGDTKNALLYIEQAIQHDSTFAKGYYLMGYIKYKMGKTKEAKEAFANAYGFDTQLQIPDFIK